MMKITATLLILSSVLVKAVPGVFHEEVGLTGCSHPDKNTDAVSMYGLDGEVLWYADFIKGKGEGPQPTFIDHITYRSAYVTAQAYQDVCKRNLIQRRAVLKNPPLELEAPDSSLYPREHVVVGVANTLICHVTGFYPAPVSITWTRNNLNLTDDITASVPFPKGDGTFYQFSRLKIIPEQGDTYSCTINHQSLPGPETRVWDLEQDQPSVGPDVFCGVGLTLGLLGFAMGTFFLIKGKKCH